VTSAVETFALQLARASKRGSRHLRGLNAADRDDVIASAVLWCFEHRAEFDPSKRALDDWFASRLKAARRQSRQPQARGQLEALIAQEDTERAAEARTSLERLTRELTDTEQAIAMKLGEGLSVNVVTDMLGASRGTVRGLQRRLRRMRELLPSERPMLTLAAPAPEEQDDKPPAPIDRALQTMLGGPQLGKECPPCWRCMWFYGLLPEPTHWHPSQIVDDEVRAAVRATERRKIEIANHVRANYVAAFDDILNEDHDHDCGKLHSDK